MARKSRRTNQGMSIPQDHGTKTDAKWETAAYARLSIENEGHETEDTIQTQIELLAEYITEHDELKLVDTYVDNGYTGTNFRRPDFERMMEDVRKGKIHCIVVKDLSRFGRDYLETGYYIETIFPFLGVRLIAINDNFDSIRRGDVEGLETPIKNLVNDLYAKDISRKVYSAAHAKMKRAVPMSIMAPYGYFVNKEEEKYEVDPDTAWYVRLIFHWALEGVSIKEIARRLDLAEVPTRRDQLIKIGVNLEEKKENRWSSGAINSILSTPVYTGAMVSGKYEKALFAGRKKEELIDRENWLITEGTHEPIVSKEDYEAVKSLLDESHGTYKERVKRKEFLRKEQPDELKGMVFCADCGTHMTFIREDKRVNRKGNYYKCCGIYKGRICSGHRIQESLLKTLVMDEIFRFADYICDREKVLGDLCQKRNMENPLYKADRKIHDTAVLTDDIRKKRERLYEDFANGILEAEDYTCMSKIYMEQLTEATAKQEEAVKEKQNLEQMICRLHSQAAEISGFKEERTFHKEMVEKLVDRIEVGREKTVHIIFKFTDVFEDVLASEENTGKGGTS